MTNYANQDNITSLSAASSDGLTDGFDNIHSGIIKVLSKASKGNYIAEYGSSQFQQTAGSSRTQFGFSGNIKYFREGRAYVGNPTACELASDPNGTNDRYDMIVIRGTSLVAISGNDSTTPVVPTLLSGDVPVALVKVEGGSGLNITNRHLSLIHI